MKTKRTVGIIALVFVAISFIAWMLLIFTRAAFNEGGGFSIWVPIVFLSFFISIVTAAVCLAGDAIRFAGKMFSSGFNGTPASPAATGGVKYCTKCGKQMEASAAFCPGCGHKQNQ